MPAKEKEHHIYDELHTLMEAYKHLSAWEKKGALGIAKYSDDDFYAILALATLYKKGVFGFREKGDEYDKAVDIIDDCEWYTSPTNKSPSKPITDVTYALLQLGEILSHAHEQRYSMAEKIYSVVIKHDLLDKDAKIGFESRRDLLIHLAETGMLTGANLESVLDAITEPGPIKYQKISQALDTLPIDIAQIPGGLFEKGVVNQERERNRTTSTAPSSGDDSEGGTSDDEGPSGPH